MKTLFWLVFAAMAAVYAAMLLWTLPQIAADAGGLAPFDMRPFGYSLDEARAFLGALSADGKTLYIDVQHRLDLVYPALLAATLSLAAARLGQTGWLRWAAIAAALSGMVFDYLENWTVGRMLEAGPESLTVDLVAAASRWTVLKSAFTTVAMLAVVAMLAWRFILKRRA